MVDYYALYWLNPLVSHAEHFKSDKKLSHDQNYVSVAPLTCLVFELEPLKHAIDFFGTPCIVCYSLRSY